MKHTSDSEYYRIVSYIYGHPDLPDDVRADIDSWMLRHENDSAAQAAMQTLWDANFGRSGRSVDSADLLSFMAALNRKTGAGTTRTQKRRRGFLRYAAAAVVALVSSALIFLAGTTMATETTSLATADGTVGRYTLPDGSKVILNSNSRLTYTTGGLTGGFRRKVQLDGEAYFDIVRDVEHPFTVDVADATVQVLGTSFDVRAYAASRTTEVVLLKGKVAVTPGNARDKNRAVTLAPGDMLTIDRTDGLCTLETVEAIDYCQWHTPRIKLENKSLGSVLVNIGRRYCLDLELDPGLDLDRRLTLTLTAADDIDQTMSVVARIARIDYSVAGSTLKIKPNTNHITKQQ